MSSRHSALAKSEHLLPARDCGPLRGRIGWAGHPSGAARFSRSLRGNGRRGDSTKVVEARRAHQLDQEVPAHDEAAGGEDDVTGQAHPLPEPGCVVEGLAPRPRIAMLINGVELRPADGEEVQEYPHHQPNVVAPKGNSARPLIEDRAGTRAIAQAEIDETERKQAKGAEQRRVRVVERQESAVLIIIDQRRVDRSAAEHAGADEIPERRAENVEIGQAVIEALRPCGALDRPVLRNRFENQQNERQHLDEREHRAQWHPHARTSGPIEVVTGAENAAHEDQDQLEIHRPFGELA